MKSKSNQDSSHLIEQLLNNKLSRAELDDFLTGLHDENAVQVYSGVLKTHFDDLLNQHDLPSTVSGPEE